MSDPNRTAPMRSTTYSLATLDEPTKEYLRQVADSAGTSEGVLLSKGGKGAGGWFSLLLGGGAVALAMKLVVPNHYAWFNVLESEQVTWRTILLAVGLALMGRGLWSIVARRRWGSLGKFVYLDSRYLWEARGTEVKATPVEALLKTTGTHHINNGSYTHTTIKMESANDWRTLHGGSRERAEEFVMFANACSMLRTQLSPELAALVAIEPGLLMQMARRLLRGGTGEQSFDPGQSVTIPTPEGGALPFLSRRMAWGLAGLLLGAVIGAIVLPPIAAVLAEEQAYQRVVESPSYSTHGDAGLYLEFFPDGKRRPQVLEIREERAYQRVVESDRTTTTEADDYLTRLPDGRRRQEVLEIRDDRRWNIAEDNARFLKSPSKLRDYLVDAQNTRHRAAAQTMIDQFYDDAAQRVRELSKKSQGLDQTLFDSLLALLEALKKAPTPVVTVAFVGTVVQSPTEAGAIAREKVEHAQYAQEHPEIKKMAASSPGGTAILPVGDVFNAEQMRRREDVILGRFRDAISKVLDADIISLQLAAPNQAADVQVKYHCRAPGTLYIYTSTMRSGVGPPTRVIKGLLRGYEMTWELKIKPPGQAREHLYRVASRPAESLRLSPRPGDPDWAPYAVLFYSAFHDFSSKFISGCGLTPPPSPNSFSFSDATGSKEEGVDPPGSEGPEPARPRVPRPAIPPRP